MSEFVLPEKYRFDEELLTNYRSGDKFPRIDFENDKRVVAEPNHPLAGFVQFYINTVLELDRNDWGFELLILNASKEMRFINKQAGVPYTLAPTEEEIKAEGIFGSIERLKLYVAELERAVNYSISKGVPKNEWPLNALIHKKEDVKESLQMIIEQEGKPSFIVIWME